MTDQYDTRPALVIQGILEERARALAHLPEAERDGEYLDLVVLILGDECYGVEVHYVQEIRPLGGLTPVPGAPPIWAGVMNVRGHLYPILSLRRYLALPEHSAPADGSVVLAVASGLTVGLLADDIYEIRRVPRSELAPPLATAAGAKHDMVLGITADWITVLDIEALLTDPRLVVQDDAH